MSGFHEFYEQPFTRGDTRLCRAWHRYPDGYTVEFTAQVGYAVTMASFYNKCGRPSKAWIGQPVGRVDVEGD